MFEVNLVIADYYMSKPIRGLDLEYSEFRGYAIKDVPIIRIFGPTRKGHKACLHIHGVFPYIYIPFDGAEPCGQEIYRIVSALDRAINAASGHVNSAVQHIYNVHLVSGIPFYGYHSKESQFLKLFFYNPATVKKAVELLQSGAVLNKVFQAYEAHIPFILQFMIDYKLHGMSYVAVTQVMFRRGSVLDVSVPEEQWLPESVKKLSICRIEGDVQACSIIPPSQNEAHRSINPGLTSIWEEEKQRRRNENIPSQMTPQTSQDRPELVETDCEIAYKTKLKEKLSVAFLQAADEKAEAKTQAEGNQYVYPEETPEGSNLLQASHIVNHADLSVSAGSGAASTSGMFNNAIFVNLPSSDGVHSEIGALSFEFNSQDVDLAILLDDLAAEKQFDDDSILGSQKICEENCEDDDDLLSQSMTEKLNLAAEDGTETIGRQGNYSRMSCKEEDKNSKCATNQVFQSDPTVTVSGQKMVTANNENEIFSSSKKVNTCSCLEKGSQSRNGMELAGNNSQVNRKQTTGLLSSTQEVKYTQKDPSEIKKREDTVKDNTIKSHCTLCNTQNSYCRTRRRRKSNSSDCDTKIKENVKVKPCHVQLERLQDSDLDFLPTITIERQTSGSTKLNYLDSSVLENSSKSEKNKHQSTKTSVPSLDGANDSGESHDLLVNCNSGLHYSSTSSEQGVKPMKKKNRRRRHNKLKLLKETNEENPLVQESLVYEKNKIDSHLVVDTASASFVLRSGKPDVPVGDKAGEKREDNCTLQTKPARTQSDDKHSPVRTQKRSSYKTLNIVLQKSPKKDENNERTLGEIKEFLVHSEDQHPDEIDCTTEADEASLDAAESLLQFKYGFQQSDKEVPTSGRAYSTPPTD